MTQILETKLRKGAHFQLEMNTLVGTVFVIQKAFSYRCLTQMSTQRLAIYIIHHSGMQKFGFYIVEKISIVTADGFTKLSA